jgi:hypothetical protein
LKRDTVDNIAKTIAGSIGFSRLRSLQQALAKEIKYLKDEQKQAG